MASAKDSAASTLRPCFLTGALLTPHVDLAWIHDVASRLVELLYFPTAWAAFSG